MVYRNHQEAIGKKILWATSIKVMLLTLTQKNTDRYRGSPLIN